MANTGLPTLHGVPYGPLVGTPTLGWVHIGDSGGAGLGAPLVPSGSMQPPADRN